MMFFDLLSEKKCDISNNFYSTYDNLEAEYIGALRESSSLYRAKNQLHCVFTNTFDLAIINISSNCGFMFTNRSISTIYLCQCISKMNIALSPELTCNIHLNSLGEVSLAYENQIILFYSLHVVDIYQNCFSFQLFGTWNSFIEEIKKWPKVIFKEKL